MTDIQKTLPQNAQWPPLEHSKQRMNIIPENDYIIVELNPLESCLDLMTCEECFNRLYTSKSLFRYMYFGQTMVVKFDVLFQ